MILLSIMLPFIMIFVGIYGLISSKTVIKSIVSLNIIQTGIILLFLSFANMEGNSIPILSDKAEKMVDPLPQALMITTIVIGAAVTALCLIFSIKLFHYYGTLNWEELVKRED